MMDRTCFVNKMGCGDGKSPENIYGKWDFNAHVGMTTAEERSQVDDASEI